MRHCLIAAMSFFLTSCAAPNTPAQTAFALEAGYDAAINIAIAYASLPRCAPAVPQPCSEPVVVRRTNTVAHQAWGTIRAAQSAVQARRADPAGIAPAIAAAQAALAALRAITDQMKVSGS